MKKVSPILVVMLLVVVCVAGCTSTSPQTVFQPTPTPTEEPTSTPRNIIINPTSTPTSPISSVVLKILQNDAEALVFGFDFLDASGQLVNFSDSRSTRFCGQIWQGHLDSPISYVVDIDTNINTNLDTVTIPYSVLDFSDIDKSQPVWVDFRIYGLNLDLDNYWFQESVAFTGEFLQLPTSIGGK